MADARSILPFVCFLLTSSLRTLSSRHWLVLPAKMIASPLSISKWKLKDQLELSYDFQGSVGEAGRLRKRASLRGVSAIVKLIRLGARKLR